ncbi:MAG: hypothetical protein APR63_02865 [Desulfuromonas sp. SDB]|nr:MAG: hypothetical protein APR63_02865 [Desulfuromonas sp. SDB]
MDGKFPKILVTVVGLIIVLIIGLIDYLTGFEFRFSVFYIIPIFLVTWFADEKFGLVISAISLLVWFYADLTSGQVYSHHLFHIWNFLITLIYFVIITILLISLKKTMEREKELARRDFLTGAANSLSFYDLLQIEINRLNRYNHPFSIAYIDLDNFKVVNDQYGHGVGDRVLASIVGTINRICRKTDVVARLGGDEFAMLFPETDQYKVKIIVNKIQNSLLKKMKSNNWNVTFSIGVLTMLDHPPSAREIVHLADELMYSVKNESKNNVRYSVYPG